MLKRVRIEVEEDTAEACVEALWKYELALQQQEVRRYRGFWPVTLTAEVREASPGQVLPEIESMEEGEYPTPDEPWSVPVEQRTSYEEQLGREIHEEVIEYDASLPGYRGRRVVAFNRIDTRSDTFLKLGTSGSSFAASISSNAVTMTTSSNSGSN